MRREQDYCKTVTDETYEDRFNGRGEFKGHKMNRNIENETAVLKCIGGINAKPVRFVSKHHN